MKRICFAILAIFLLAAVPWAAEVEVLKPRGNLEIKLGHPSTISFYDMPAVMTQERLNSHGWNIKSVEFTRTDLNVQALAQGTVQIANSQVMDPVRAIQKGAKLFFVMENNGGEFVMVAKNEIKDCKDTDGKKFAIHGEAATTSWRSSFGFSTIARSSQILWSFQAARTGLSLCRTTRSTPSCCSSGIGSIWTRKRRVVITSSERVAYLTSADPVSGPMQSG